MLNIIKIGGKVIDDPEARQAFLNDFAAASGPKILIHGGGKIATRIATRLGVESTLVEGRRITTPEMMSVVTMVYGGLVSKEIVAALQGLGCNALGLSGADGNLIEATRRPVGRIDYGLAGDISSVNRDLLELLLSHQLTPVVAPLSHNKAGQLLNTNADTIAAEVAISLAGRGPLSLIYCFEMPGVLRNAQDPKSVIPTLNVSEYQALKSTGDIFEGMIPKLDNAFRVARTGVMVRIGSAAQLPQLLTGQAGTVLSCE